MSLILDALRKSEQDRRASDILVPGEMPMPASEPPARPRWLIGATVALAAGLILTAIYFMIPRRGETEASVPVVASVVPAVVEPAVSVPEPPAEPAPPVLQTNAFAPAPATGGARDLAQEAQVESTQPKKAPAVVVAAVAPAPQPVAVAPAPPSLKFLRGMSPQFQKSLPELVMNIHIYSVAEVDRLLYINNQPYVAGQKIQDDLVVEEIVPDGAVLSFRGQRFKLPRPS